MGGSVFCGRGQSFASVCQRVLVEFVEGAFLVGVAEKVEREREEGRGVEAGGDFIDAVGGGLHGRTG
jgi:hypothetical protein